MFGVDVTLEDARRFKQVYFETYPELRVLNNAIQDGLDTSPSGRKLPGFYRAPENGRGSFINRLNAFVAGFASDCMLAACLKLYRAGYQPVLLTHDEAVFEVPQDDVQAFLKLAEPVLRQPPVPMFPGWEWGEYGFRYSLDVRRQWSA